MTVDRSKYEKLQKVDVKKKMDLIRASSFSRLFSDRRSNNRGRWRGPTT